MIINVRGTSGSGKTTLIRRVMEHYNQRNAYYASGFTPAAAKRSRPMGYTLHRDEGRGLGLIGHYEVDCGGCDTINNMDLVFELVRRSANMGLDVLFEGLLVSADFARCAKLHSEGHELHVIALNTPIEQCVASIQQRRNAKALRSGNVNPKLVNPKNTISKFKHVQNSERRFLEANIPFYWCSRDEAYDKIKELLCLTG
jgi:Cdc6-like AAA superfamily ATPase